MALEENTPRVAYRGFVSYSHKDAGIGRTIHRRLEGYRLPKHLIGSETALAAVPARLTPIFRDREELSAGESLSDQVQAALDASGCLIVLCSPDARASKWVAKEIETFRALHPGKPVLAALIAGEPAEAFPDALTAGGAEPIAADFRKEGDGQRLALLKLVAGMTGVSLDALVQRDAQRRLRGVMAITGGAIIALLILSALLVVALRARAEADRQRAEAEGLVEYMLTDLRDKLKGVGRLDVMTAVNERAMRYYGGESLKGQLLKARTLHAMGEDDINRGNTVSAAKRFAEAEATTSAMLEQRPSDTDAIFAHAQTVYWIGYIHFLRRDYPEARERWTQYRSLAARLVQVTGPTPKSLRELGYAQGNLCSLALEPPPRPTDAIAACGEAMSTMTAVSTKLNRESQSLKDLANRHAWMADAYLANGSRRQAFAHRLLQEELLVELLSRDPKNAEFSEGLMLAKLETARTSLMLKDVKLARSRISDARKLHARLVAIDSQNSRWRDWDKRITALDKTIK